MLSNWDTTKTKEAYVQQCMRGIQKVLRQILKKNSEYGNQIESCKYPIVTLFGYHIQSFF